MKKTALVLFLVIMTTLAYGQVRQRRQDDEGPMRKIERLEKAKLIEILDLTEENSMRFFARRNEYQQKQRELYKEREKILEDLEHNIREDNVNDTFYKEQVQRILQMESKIMAERENFLNSLNDLLTPQQIAKLTVFEFKFRKELTQSLMSRGKNSRQN